MREGFLAKDKKTIVITGGGTGGHLMPALAMCEITSRAGYYPILITDSRCEPFLPKDNKFKTHIINLQRLDAITSIYGFFKSLIQNIIFLFKLFKSEKVILSIGCGGYSSLPILLVSIFSRTKFILHEQNAYLGRANYWFSYFATTLFTSFMHTVNIPLIDSSKIIWTGIPIPEKHKNQKASEKDEKTKLIVITGGSGGAAILDEIVPGSMKILLKKFPNYNFKIIQQSRNAEDGKVENEYKKMKIESEVKKFFHNMEDYYSDADIFIGRSGASTISEVINYLTPSILIPYPFAKDDHQTQNAMNLKNFNAAEIIEQKNLSAKSLSTKIEEILFNKDKIKEIKWHLGELKINTNEIIISEIKKIIDKDY
jgi:UDP-N-acetylglucosamine--N-acetylmuramyl-(pentapeptide) pyrophosphoryl-undecaprenol N-acetylglucosamine transferase